MENNKSSQNQNEPNKLSKKIQKIKFLNQNQLDFRIIITILNFIIEFGNLQEKLKKKISILMEIQA
jgi:hypothetical protein